MLKVVKPKTNHARRILEKRAPKLVENAKKILILHGTKTSNVLNSVLTDIFHLKRAGGNAIKYTKKNGDIRPFESGGETALDFLSQKTDCSLFVVRFMHCGVRLKKSGTIVPRIELVEIGPSMDLVHRRHRLPNDDLRKEAMKSAILKPNKKVKNVSGDLLAGKVGKIYVPKQEVGDMALAKMKGLKRERREAAAALSASKNKTHKENENTSSVISNKKQRTG